mmetsp:Transcript_18117/g.49709  ORF Transcript_18117/g.49709 Transcript_18117/m.49709 type:complete len:223 (-) Transcript_18117:24-692(-)
MPTMNPYCGYAAPISPSMGAMCTPSSMGFGMSQFTSTTPMYGAQCPTPTNSNTVLSLADAISAPPSQPATFSLSAMLMGTRQPETARSAPGPPPCEPPSMINSGPMMLAPASAPSAPPSAPPSGPALGCSELPSVGSTEHGAGMLIGRRLQALCLLPHCRLLQWRRVPVLPPVRLGGEEAAQEGQDSSQAGGRQGAATGRLLGLSRTLRVRIGDQVSTSVCS